MNQKKKYSVFLGNVGACFDRYCPAYEEPFSVAELFDRVASIDLLSGVDLVATPGLLDDLATVKKKKQETGLQIVSIAVDIFTQKIFKQGSYSSIDHKIRQKAIDDAKKLMGIAADLDCPSITFWPGQDGYDYIFQADYLQERTWFTDSVREI